MDTEIRRGAGKDRADAGGGEHRDDRFGHIGRIGGDAVAGADARSFERGSEWATCWRNSVREDCALDLIFAQNTSASGLSQSRSRFSAKLSRACGNHLAPGIRWGSISAGPTPRSPTTPQKSQIAVQNDLGCSTDHACKSA